jgi:hypothetical protein
MLKPDFSLNSLIALKKGFIVDKFPLLYSSHSHAYIEARIMLGIPVDCTYKILIFVR